MIDQNIVRGHTSDPHRGILPLFLAAIAPVFFIATTVVGAIRWFSPVPFWDMWDGYLRFYMDVKYGDHGAFFVQANEHRILLSKVLFWLDLKYFGGLSYLLIPINLLLMMGLWALFIVGARSLIAQNRRLTYYVSMLVVFPCFSWLNTENLNWAYQSQFFLAYLLPMAALMSFAVWAQDPSRERWFVAALSFGVLSTISMANGLLALPLLIVMLILSGRFSWSRLLVLIGVTAITFALWKRHYDSIPRPSAGALAEIKFALLFLGGPIANIFHSFALGILVGVAVVIACVFLAWQWLRRATDNQMFLALGLFLVYVIAAAAAAAHSRAFFGLDAAPSQRYGTPPLLVYATILLLFVHLYRARAGAIASVSTLAVVVPMTLFAFQLSALKDDGPNRAWERMQAALALNLGVIDNAATGTIYPANTPVEVDRVHKIASDAAAINLSVFGLPEMQAARRAIGNSPEVLALHKCSGHIDAVDSIKSDSRFEHVSGWAFDEKNQRVPKVAFPVVQDVVVGAALTGQRRDDVRQSVGVGGTLSGFQGYMWTGRQQDATIYCGN